MSPDIHIERPELAPVPDIGHRLVDEWADYAVITAGEIEAKVQRWCYWDPRDRAPMEVRSDAFANGLPETAGCADLVAQQPEKRFTLSRRS